MLRCSKCGTEYRSGAETCSDCGESLVWAMSYQVGESEPAPLHKSIAIPWLWIAATLAPILGLFIIWWASPRLGSWRSTTLTLQILALSYSLVGLLYGSEQASLPKGRQLCVAWITPLLVLLLWGGGPSASNTFDETAAVLWLVLPRPAVGLACTVAGYQMRSGSRGKGLLLVAAAVAGVLALDSIMASHIRL